MSATSEGLYCREDLRQHEPLIGMDKEDRLDSRNVLQRDCLDFRMRDGLIEAEFEMTDWKDEFNAWFGVFFRAGAPPGRDNYQDLLLGSYLAYVRPNGSTEIVQ